MKPHSKRSHHRSKKQGNLVEKALDEILNRIFAEKILPGQILSQRALANEFGMSYQPIGTAMKRLEYEGLLKSLPRTGVQINLFDLNGLCDMLQDRIAREQRAVQLACRLATDEEIDELEKLAAPADVIHDDPNEFTEADTDFHRALAACSHSSWLQWRMESLRVFRAKFKLCQLMGWPKEDLQYLLPRSLPGRSVSHQKLIDILRTRNETEAIRAIEIHILPGGLRNLPVFQKRESY